MANFGPAKRAMTFGLVLHGACQLGAPRVVLSALKMRARTNTVVIIEDEPAAADALAMIIRDWGADVAVGADTTAITEQLGPRVNEVGWIITDFDLGPGPDGVTLTQAFAAGAPAAKILVLSGSHNGRAAAAAAKAGYDSMQKPARAEKIVSWLERA